MKHTFQVLCSSLLLLCSLSGNAFADLVVIAHPSTKIDVISTREARDIFMGHTTLLYSISVSPVDQIDGSKSRRDFFMSVAKKKEGQINSHWTRMILSGKASPMVVAGKDKDVLVLVSKRPNTVGYIDESLVNSSVKVILKVPVKS